MLRMEEQKRKSPSMLNLFILIKRSKNTKGKAEHISFLVAEGRGALAVWCSALALKSARECTQASRQTPYLALHLCCCSSAQILSALFMWCESDTFTQKILYSKLPGCSSPN